MSLAYYELKASYAFVERNINLVKRYWGWEVVWMMYTIANSLAVVLIARGANDAAGATEGGGFNKAQVDQLVLFLAIGALVWHYLAVVFQTVSEMISWSAGKAPSNTRSWRRSGAARTWSERRCFRWSCWVMPVPSARRWPGCR